jgi:hypothetical protein
MSKKQGEGNNGCLGCLAVIIILWLVFWGGFDRINRALDTTIQANEKKIQEQTPAQPTAPAPVPTVPAEAPK